MSGDHFKPLKSAIWLAELPVQTDRMRRLQALCASCDSIIEKDMAQALIDNADLCATGAPTIVTQNETIEGPGDLVIVSQHGLGRFRADFALIMAGGRKVVIECDGIEWHDRTNQQFISERQRERDILILGWPVMRFTGAELMRDPDACAADVAAYLCGGAS
jgi:very-short-patch-repair endonuclease